MKYFLPKKTYFTHEVTVLLIKDFHLTVQEILSIKNWNNDPSYSGTIISISQDEPRIVPYEKNQIEFLIEYPEGEVWKLSERRKFLDMIDLFQKDNPEFVKRITRIKYHILGLLFKIPAATVFGGSHNEQGLIMKKRAYNLNMKEVKQRIQSGGLAELKKSHNFGKKSIQTLKDFLEQY